MNYLTSLEKKSPIFWAAVGCLFVVMVGVADYETGNDLSFSLFYLIPIVFVTWFSGRNLGLFISVVAAIAWFIAEKLVGDTYVQPLIPYWNAGVRLGFFVVVTLLLPALKELEREKEIARIDHLTGIANRRHFFEVIQAELDRSQRNQWPFTIAYIDLDGFKGINDQFGHQVGDALLCAIVNCAKQHLRKTDFMARLGGDEFVMLFPEIGEDAARVIVPKIQVALLAEMQLKRWPVTFSIGALTYQGAPSSVDDLIKRADDLMYSVKTSGKNAISYAVYTG